ncbi:hypothetical protein ASC61_17800 [Aeromicrobium sp. Root344]|uniref:DUF6167 family protein n=1 Tax=Aeromicrobium sp. Root344 TaxID=1736521 RepID=UPI0006FCDF00|nr:DUF6167 family protein [Aeromicrobium sp. Root344]KQV76705.1 hypothetical protein ASC61_17800 [Aeromicrobium sp. Root344]
MRSRVVWFVAGSAAGLYASVKARRAAYRLSTPGLVDQAAALGLGWRAFSSELRDGMEARQRDIARGLSGAPDDHTDLLRLEAEHTQKDQT